MATLPEIPHPLTAEAVKDQLKWAAGILKRARGRVGPAGYRSSMPDVVRDWQGYGFDKEPMPRPQPDDDELDRAIEVGAWLRFLPVDDQRFIWAWAGGMPRARMAAAFDCHRNTVGRWVDGQAAKLAAALNRAVSHDQQSDNNQIYVANSANIGV